MFLSIIVPIYNTRPEYIDECLNSVKQIGPDIDYEVIVINDGSNDVETLKKVDSLRSEYQIIDQVNKGLPSARNTGIRAAKGKYILPLDSDDLIHPEFNLFITQAIKCSEADLIYGNIQKFGDDNSVYISKPNFSLLELMYENQIPVSSMYKKEVWELVSGYDESYKTIEDWDFWIRLKQQNLRFVNVNHFVICYRRICNGQSLYQKTENLVKDFHKKTLSKVTFGQFTKQEISNYIVGNMIAQKVKAKKRRLIYLILYILAPKFFEKYFSKKKFW